MRSIESMKKDRWKPDREMPLLDDLISSGRPKMWNSGAPALVQKTQMKKALAALKEEHQYMCDHEPQDQFHACVLLGAINLIEGLLSKRKARKWE
jgi:hypothetical protein